MFSSCYIPPLLLFCIRGGAKFSSIYNISYIILTYSKRILKAILKHCKYLENINTIVLEKRVKANSVKHLPCLLNHLPCL